MTSKRVGLVTIAAAVLVVAAVAARPIALRAQQSDLPPHPGPESKDGGVVMKLCDGKTSVQVKGLEPGQHMTHERALAVARELMAEWQRKHPDQHWEMAQADQPNGGAETGAVRPVALAAQPIADTPPHPVALSKDGHPVVMLCDGKTSLELKGLKPGETMTHDQALGATQELMAEWQRNHPGEHWQMAQAQPPNQAPAVPAGSSQSQPAGAAGEAKPQVMGAPASSPPAMQQGDTYASFHERDYKLWQAETQKFVDEGNRIFHSDKALGGTIGVSCDMCHPNASNTHPETYPKYQVQLQRVALLRDMINWCIENPVKGKAMDPNDPRLRALEAYILAQRKGASLAYGKH